MRMLTRFLTFSFYFAKTLESAPINRANATLSKFIKERVEKEKYEQSFSAYQAYLQRIVNDNPAVDHHKLSLLDHCTRIYSIYRIPSKKLNRIHNEIADQCLQFTTQQGSESLVFLLSLILRYNQKKSIAVFKANKQAISKDLRKFPIPTLMVLIRFLKEAKIDDAMIRETAIEMLYGELDYLSEMQLVMLSSYLCLSRKYINKDFLVRFAARVTQLYRSSNLQQKLLLAMLSNLSEIEVNLHSRAIFIDELDTLYELAFPSLFATINAFDDRQLTQLVSALRRSKFYNETMLNQLVEAATKREIIQLAAEQPSSNKAITLATFVNIVNTLAVFNHQVPEFKRYLISILKLLAQHKHDLLTPHHFSRLVWSLCVLFDRHELRDAYPLIERSLARPEPFPLHDAMNFYLCYLYMRTAYPQINEHRDKIHKCLEGFALETHTSQAQREAFQLLKGLGVPCLMEYNLNNLICDIMVPEWQNLRNTVIEFHGFRHFCRNAKKLTGSTILKRKIITAERYGYYFIAIDEWLISQDKKEFLTNFIQHINAAEAAKSNQNAVTTIPKTATRVRSRPKTFKIST